MAALNLNSISENASRLGMRIQESFSEHTRDIIIRGSSSAIFDTPDDRGKDIRKQLDSSSDREKLDAMKRLIALISKGRNVSEYFAQVVKNVSSHNLEIRKLVYIYLLRYSTFEPDLALLSINSFQKDLNDSSPLIRAMALRVLSGIRVSMIGSIVVLAIKKCSADSSPYVRKAAALAIPKCYQLDESHLPSLIPIVMALLRDRSPLAIGAASLAFQTICPTRLDLLHPLYRRLCRVLVDVDEWGQVELMDLLVRYARNMLARPSVIMRPTATGEDTEEEVDKDLELLLTSAEPLFQSCNPAVVLAVARLFYYLAPPSKLSRIVQPLVRLPHISPQVERVALAYILLISYSHPTLFAPHYTGFLVRTHDIHQIKLDKISLLLNIVIPDNLQFILREFVDYSEDVDDSVVAASIQAIGRCPRNHPALMQQCLTALMTMIKSTHSGVVSNAVVVLKSLVQSQLQTSISSSQSTLSAIRNETHPAIAIIAQLAQKIVDIKHSEARACVIWLVGQYAESGAQSQGTSDGIDGIAAWAPDVLRQAAKAFLQETTDVKLQISTLAAKLLVLAPESQPLILLSRYVFSLARYDTNYDVRDRARMLVNLLAGLAPDINGEADDGTDGRSGVVLRREQVKRVLFEGKAGIVEAHTRPEDENLTIGSLGVITGKDMHGDRLLPYWLENGVQSSLRDAEEEIPAQSFSAMSSAQSQSQPHTNASKHVPRNSIVLTPTGSPAASPGTHGGGKEAWKDLDKFYESDSEEEESEASTNSSSDDVDEDDGEESDENEEDEPEEESEEDDEESHLSPRHTDA